MGYIRSGTFNYKVVGVPDKEADCRGRLPSNLEYHLETLDEVGLFIIERRRFEGEYPLYILMAVPNNGSAKNTSLTLNVSKKLSYWYNKGNLANYPGDNTIFKQTPSDGSVVPINLGTISLEPWVADTSKCDNYMWGNFDGLNSWGLMTSGVYEGDAGGQEVYSTIPIFEFNQARDGDNACSFLASKVFPYILEGDYGGAKNSDFIEEPKLHFTVYISDEEQGFYVRCEPNVPVDNLNFSIKLKSVKGDLESNGLANSETDIMYTYQFVSEHISPALLGVFPFILYAKGEGQDGSFSVYEEFFYQKNKMNIPNGERNEKLTSDNGKNTLEIVFGKPPDNNGYDDTSNSDENNNDNSNFEQQDVNTLTHTYKISELILKNIGNILWSESFFDNIKLVNNNPIENIVSLKCAPVDINGIQSQEITLGNVKTGLEGTVVQPVARVKGKEFTIRKKFNSFLDTKGFTTVSLYSPLLGMVQLDTNMVMGRVCRLDYIIDVQVGSVTAEFYATINSKETLLYVFSGEGCIDIPLSASNRGKFMQSIESMFPASESFMEVAFNFVPFVNSSSFTTTTKGSPSPLTKLLQTNSVYLIIVRPKIDVPKTYGHDVGRLCMLSKRLRDLKGYTKCLNPDLDGVDCNGVEKDELYNILTSGFYIK